MTRFVKLFEEFAEDYPKHKFVEIPSRAAMNYSSEIFNLIQTAYSNKGGNAEIKKAEDLKNTDISYWVLKDIDQDPEADVVFGGKFTKSGIKVTIIGQDGSSDAKREVLKKLTDLMKTGGFYAELDKDLAQKIGVAHIKDENTIRSIINKELKYNSDGSYDRKIAGHTHTKVLVGKPE
jgi:hypothetical protein